MIKAGATDAEIVNEVSRAYTNLDKIQRVRSMYRDQQFTNCWRDLEVTYIFGVPGAGKSRYVMDKYGYLNVYRVTDYKHPFDTYDGQDVVVFEEYRSQFKIADCLTYLDGYPLLLPCRYFNRQAFFVHSEKLRQAYDTYKVIHTLAKEGFKEKPLEVLNTTVVQTVSSRRR